MALLDRYILKQILVATLFIAMILAGIVFLTQSLRFLELVLNSGASSFSFWILTGLALPRFFEIILPLALFGAVLFVYNRISADSELVVMRAAGMSPLRMARPALALTAAVVAVLLFMTMWLAPVSLANMQHMRQVIKAQYSTLLFREGVFNQIRDGLTVYVRERTNAGELQGLIIHDQRPDKREKPVTVIAKRGVVVNVEEGQQVLVFDGSRQDIDPDTGALNRLDFGRYSIDIPEGSGPVRQRWREPDERTFWQLLNPNTENLRDRESRYDFMVEAHRRVVSPFLAPAFVLIGLCAMLIGPVDRRGNAWRISLAITLVVVLQGLYLAAFNIAIDTIAGLVMMYVLVLSTLIGASFLLTPVSERLRRNVLYERGRA